MIFKSHKTPTELKEHIAALAEKDATLCIAEINEMCETGNPQVVQPLLYALTDAPLEVHDAATTALLKMQEPDVISVIPELLEVLRSKETVSRKIAARVLGDFTNPDGVSLLHPHLRSHDPFVRAAIARTLGKWAATEAIPQLVPALVDIEPEVRRVVAKALRRLGESRWQHMVTGIPDDFRRLAETGDARLRDPFIRILENAGPHGRTLAAQALGRMKDGAALPALYMAMRANAPAVRAAAVEAIGRIGDVEAMPKLLEMLNDENESVRSATIKALDLLDEVHQRQLREEPASEEQLPT